MTGARRRPRRRPARGNDERRLRAILLAVLVALAVPGAVLIREAFSQLEVASFREHQISAELVAGRIDAALAAAIAAEDARGIDDYRFAADAARRSALSALPVVGALPGTIGYFEVAPDGGLATPLLPADGVDAQGWSAAELARRRSVAAAVGDVLATNSLVRERPAPAETRAYRAERAARPPAEGVAPASDERVVAAPPESGPRGAASRDAAPESPAPEDVAASAAPAPRADADAAGAAGEAKTAANADAGGGGNRSAPDTEAAPETGESAEAALEAGQAAFDRLAQRAGGPGADAASGDAVNGARRQLASSRAAVTFADSAEEAESDAALGEAVVAAARSIGTFQSELEPFQLGLLDTGHLVIFRNAWRDGERYVQGALLDRALFLETAVTSAFAASPLAAVSRLDVAFRDRGLAELGAAAGPAATLYRTRLSPPFADLELTFAAGSLPPGPGFSVLVWTSVALAAVLGIGLWAVYRTSLEQIRLVRQQRDFVSAVSHELKTPLTSIRMYGEMLKSGWADEAKRRTYYEFIYAESERLSRLIENVLELARLGRGRGPSVELEPVAVSELVDGLRSKVSTQIEQAGFELEIEIDPALAGTRVAVDTDAFSQVLINLVDNAIKFAAAAERRTIVVAARRAAGEVVFSVRDFGPGVPRGELKRLFELFYRPDNDLTRGTSGTGIGLALVRELVTAMNGQADVRNCEPGAEFRLTFAAVSPENVGE